MSPETFDQYRFQIVGEIAASARLVGLRRDHFPRLTSNSGQARMTAVVTRQGLGRVNFGSRIKTFMKQRYPAFRFERTLGDWHRFTKKASDEVSVFVEFERIHHFGLGKTFQVFLGGSFSANREDRQNLLSFFDRVGLDWTYGTVEELEQCLDEVTSLLEIALPLYEAAWASKAADRGQTTSDVATFHNAARIASEAISTRYPQFTKVTNATWREYVGPPPSMTALGRFTFQDLGDLFRRRCGRPLHSRYDLAKRASAARTWREFIRQTRQDDAARQAKGVP